MRSSADIYAAGYAIPLYTTSTETEIYRHADREFVVPAGSVKRMAYEGWPVALVTEVEKHAL